jgi:hypothetical protein
LLMIMHSEEGICQHLDTGTGQSAVGATIFKRRVHFQGNAQRRRRGIG